MSKKHKYHHPERNRTQTAMRDPIAPPPTVQPQRTPTAPTPYAPQARGEAPHAPAQATSENSPAKIEVPDAAKAPATAAAHEETIPLHLWQGEAEAVKGMAHRRNRIPCQDAARWRAQPRPFIAISDGAGSAKASDLGAHALVTGAATFLAAIDDWLSFWLDQPQPEHEAHRHAEQLSRWLLTYAQETLNHLAEAQRRAVTDLRGTLLLAIAGQRWCFWWQVGDGAVVCRRNGTLELLTEIANFKGEFANQTIFVDEARYDTIQFGLLPTATTTAVAVMSDGSAERLVAHNSGQIAQRLDYWFNEAVAQRLNPMVLAKTFLDPKFWERTTLDDCSIALMARPELPVAKPTAPAEPKGGHSFHQHLEVVARQFR